MSVYKVDPGNWVTVSKKLSLTLKFLLTPLLSYGNVTLALYLNKPQSDALVCNKLVLVKLLNKECIDP